jgi:small-conductance mechanosensitive channel
MNQLIIIPIVTVIALVVLSFCTFRWRLNTNQFGFVLCGLLLVITLTACLTTPNLLALPLKNRLMLVAILTTLFAGFNIFTIKLWKSAPRAR